MARATRRGDPVAMNENTVEQPALKRLERSRSDRMLAGVSGGLARYFDIHPAFYRVGFVVLTLLGGAGILVYVAAALVIPDEGQEDSIASGALRERRDRPWPLIGLALVGVAGACLLSRASIWPNGDAAWVLLLLAGGGILWLTRRERVEPAAADTGAPARRRSGAGRTVAVVLGTLATLVLIVTAIAAAVLHVHVAHGVGDREYRVVAVDDLQSSYSLGIGEMRLDLSSLRLPVGETHVKARVDIGKLTVIAPRDAALRVRGEANYGEVRLLGLGASGHKAGQTVEQTGKRVLVVDGHVEAGKLIVTRAVR
jgi:phage shock protein PspC (stress-responsive transcriptional regulator)